jgi:hypothetical protein
MKLRSTKKRFPEPDTLLDQYALRNDIRAKVRPGLIELIASMEEDVAMNANGHARALHSLHDDLRRLRAILDDRARYPAIAEVKISQPLFILGLPRCGTSFLHAMIGGDPQVRTPLMWEVAEPSPPPEASTFDSDPRIERFDDHLRAQLGGDFHELLKAHPIGAKIPQECGSIMTSSFQSSNPCMFNQLPRFYDWFKGIDATFRYEVHKMWLQHLSWHNSRTHWVLKIQEHMYKMPALRAVYPDAIFVQPHRDPTTIIASISQLIRVIREPAYDHQDSHALGREFLQLWWDGVKCMIDYRTNHADLPIHDMRYKDLVADPVTTIRAVYERFGWDFTPASEQGIVAWLKENPAGKHGSRKYSLAELGLNEAQVRDTFAEYIALYRDYI